MAHGSDAPNVISSVSSAVVNFRLLPGTTEQWVLSWTKRRIRDKDIALEVIASSPASRVSDISNQGFTAIEKSISAVYPSAIVTPYLITAATDALRYEQVSDAVFRFTPALMDKDELARMHNRDERFSVENLKRATQFYIHLIRHA